MVPLHVLKVGTRDERRRLALDMLEKVGLPENMADRLPAELSGGQRQRVAIARALVLRPPVLICDEPTSALDVSVQAQILNLLSDLKHEFNLSILLITHNIGIVRQIADRVVVMYLGRVVEEGRVDEVLDWPQHPYTELLVSSLLEPGRAAIAISKRVQDANFPDPFDPPSGCAFHPRCARRSQVCTEISPAPTPLEEGLVACHHPLASKRNPKSEQEWNLMN
jgi:peptide/nickel transport system ATP-binding protein